MLPTFSHYHPTPYPVAPTMHFCPIGSAFYSPRGPHRHLWWLIALLVLLAMFLIGIGVTSGII